MDDLVFAPASSNVLLKVLPAILVAQRSSNLRMYGRPFHLMLQMPT